MQKKENLTSVKRISQLNRQNRAHLDEYIQNLERLNKSTHTIKSYQNDLLQFLEWMEFGRKTKLWEINSEQIGRYIQFLTHGGEIIRPITWKNKLLHIFKFFWRNKEVQNQKKSITRSRPLGVASRKRHISCIKNFFEFLKQSNEDKNKIFLINPVKTKIHSVKLKDTDINHTRTLLQKDWEKIQYSLYRVEDKLLCGLLYWGGMRLSEVRNLEIHQFDFDTNTITFNRKGGYVHTLYPQNSPKIFELLDLHLSKKRLDSGPLFPNSKGEKYDIKSIYNWVIRICLKSGVSSNITPHSFRKACATYLYFQTKDLLYVRDYLNHKDAKVTQTYIDSKLLKSSNSPEQEMRLTVDFPKNSNYADVSSLKQV